MSHENAYRSITAIVSGLVLLFSLASIVLAASVDITPGNPQGWGFGLESGANGSGQFVTGPGTPPAGSGLISGDGSIVVENNTVSFTASTGMNIRDHGGILVFRRSFQTGNPNGYVDIPTGVVIRNNTVTGYVQQNPAATSEGFEIVIEGVNHTVSGNTIQNSNVGIHEQGGQHPNANYTPNDIGDGNQEARHSPSYFGRGNAPTACRSTVNSNSFGSGANSNDVNYRIRATTSSNSLVTNVDTSEQFCTIQTAIDDVDTLDGHTLQLASDTYTETAITVHKGITITGNGMGASVVDADGNDGFTTSANNVILQNMTLRNSDTAIAISDGSLTVRGNELYTSTLIFEACGGTFTAYANNIVTFTTGISSTAGATLNARHNWGNTHSTQPAGVDNDSWAYRLGAPVVNWGVDSLPDGAAIAGGAGTGVSVDHGTTVPFGRPTSPTGTPCSNF